MDTDHHDQLAGLHTRVADLEELVQQLGSSWTASASTSSTAFSATISGSRPSTMTPAAATATSNTTSTGSAATPKAGPGTPPPAAVGSPQLAGRLDQLVGLSAPSRIVNYHTRRTWNGLHAALAGGTLHPPAPAVCLPVGLPPRPRRGQGSLRAPECSLGPTGRPLTPPSPRRPGETRSPGASKDLSPTSRQREVRDA
jgi:hypothetical protein